MARTRAAKGEMTTQQVKKYLRAHRSSVVSWRDTGKLAAIKGRPDFYKKEVVEAFSAAFMSTTRVANHFGKHRSTIERWSSQGILPTIDGACRNRLFDRRKVEALSATLAEEATTVMTISQAAHHLRKNRITVERWANQRKLTIKEMAGGKSCFDRREVETLAEVMLTVGTQVMPTSEVAFFLGVDTKAVADWEKNGILPSIDSRFVGFFDRKTVKLFANSNTEVMSKTEVSKFLKVHIYTISRWEKKGKLVPIEGMPGRRKFFKRTAVEAIAATLVPVNT